MIFTTNFLGIIEKKDKMVDILKNDKVSIPYFETPCKIDKRISFNIVSSTSITRISLGFFYALEEAI
jgi:hypothetical protein